MELSLMSFNVRYENERDAGSRAWASRLRPIIRMLRAEKPDVFGVQEATHGQAADLWASLPDYTFHGVGRDDGARLGEYTGIFYQTARFEADPDDSGTFWYSETPAVPGSKSWGNEIPRVATWLRLSDRASGQSFYVFNTHWDHRHQGSREQSSRLLMERIATRRDTSLPVVLLGDFNAVPGNPALERLSSSSPGLVDSFRTLHPGRKDTTTLHFWKNHTDGSLKVDHILVSSTATILSVAIRSGDKPMVSDHFPVTARVVFPPRSNP